MIAKINRGETYDPGPQPGGTWLLLNIGSLNGWVNIRYVGLDNEQPLPVVGAQHSRSLPRRPNRSPPAIR